MMTATVDETQMRLVDHLDDDGFDDESLSGRESDGGSGGRDGAVSSDIRELPDTDLKDPISMITSRTGTMGERV